MDDAPLVVGLEDAADVARAHPVMHQLRPHLDVDAFVAQVARQGDQTYRLVAIETDGRPVALMGFRTMECLAWGRVFYVDDLVVDAAHRGRGLGAALLRWLRQEAQVADIDEIHLDSGLHRSDAHRFYGANGMPAVAMHFATRVRSD